MSQSEEATLAHLFLQPDHTRPLFFQQSVIFRRRARLIHLYIRVIRLVLERIKGRVHPGVVEVG